MQTATCADAWPPCPAGPAGLAGDDLRQGHSLQPNGDLVEVLTLRASRPARPGRILGHERAHGTVEPGGRAAPKRQCRRYTDREILVGCEDGDELRAIHIVFEVGEPDLQPAL